HHHSRVRHTHIEMYSSVFALMHMTRHLRDQAREVDVLAGNRELLRFELSELAQLGYERADALTRALRLLQHLLLLVGERPALLLEHHAEVPAHHGDRCTQLMHRERDRERKLVVSGWTPACLDRLGASLFCGHPRQKGRLPRNFGRSTSTVV